MLPRLGASKLISVWLALMIGATLTSLFDGGWLASWCALEPRRIFHGEVWRLVTWAFIEHGLVLFVMTCLAIFKLGGELAAPWGDARLRRYMLLMLLVGGVATSLLSLATGDATIWLHGGYGVIDALAIAWVRQFPEGTLRLWGSIEAHGAARLPMVIAVNAILALTVGVREFAPALAICAGATLYARAK